MEEEHWSLVLLVAVIVVLRHTKHPCCGSIGHFVARRDDTTGTAFISNSPRQEFSAVLEPTDLFQPQQQQQQQIMECSFFF